MWYSLPLWERVRERGTLGNSFSLSPYKGRRCYIFTIIFPIQWFVLFEKGGYKEDLSSLTAKKPLK
jgi:hypothetical protein